MVTLFLKRMPDAELISMPQDIMATIIEVKPNLHTHAAFLH